jgi:hypothetical protein
MKDSNFARMLFALTLSLALAERAVARQKSISLTPIGTYASGDFDKGGAEIVAHDPKTHRLFVVNAQAATVDVLSIKKPSRPERIGQIDVTPFGAVANSVAVHESLIAVAVENSIRIFGPGASVAQDIEPECLSISHDSQTAWVTCQENNALAIVDIASAIVVRLIGLGFKDHSAVEANAKICEFGSDTMPSIGATAAGQQLFLGGFSGLHFEGVDSKTGRYKFITHTDRGPNAEPDGINRPFLLPQFAPEIIRFERDRKTDARSPSPNAFRFRARRACR